MDAPRLSPELRPAAPGNHMRGRANTAIDLIVLHTTEADRGPGMKGLPSAVYWFASPAAKASAHYVVGRDGHLYQCVAEGDAAYHAGNLSYNLRSIGIEVEGFAASCDTWTPKVMETLAALCADIIEIHGIPVDRRHIIGHAEVPDGKGGWGGAGHHVDPGALPWDDLLESIHLELAARREPGWQDAGAGRAP